MDGAELTKVVSPKSGALPGEEQIADKVHTSGAQSRTLSDRSYAEDLETEAGVDSVSNLIDYFLELSSRPLRVTPEREHDSSARIELVQMFTIPTINEKL
ncbi:MAG: hypothetical protein K2Z81_25700 [Cyanobacteria bacterium]|nr:hypothetical protein [Cyanobacteriota bacterium]